MAIAAQPGGKISRPRRIHYPTRDGKPMAESEPHRNQMIYWIAGMQIHFADRPDVYVSGNNFLYWEPGNPRAVVSPDCYVVFGVSRHLRDLYKVWEEGGILPSVVFEATSKSTRQEDVQKKLPLYEKTLRVPECFLFDPKGDYLIPRAQGYRLVNGVYQPIPLEDDRLHSEQLGLDLVIEGDFLRMYDPVRGEFLRTPAEEAAARIAEARRAEMEARRAEMETYRAEMEAHRADAAETEVARLRAELESLRRQRE